MNKSILNQFRNTVVLWCIYKCQQNTLHVFVDNGCSIIEYANDLHQKYFLLYWHYA